MDENEFFVTSVRVIVCNELFNDFVLLLGVVDTLLLTGLDAFSFNGGIVLLVEFSSSASHAAIGSMAGFGGDWNGGGGMTTFSRGFSYEGLRKCEIVIITYFPMLKNKENTYLDTCLMEFNCSNLFLCSAST